MTAKETLSFVTLMTVIIAIIIISFRKNFDLRLSKVEDRLNDILDSSDKTKLALGYMIQDQQQALEAAYSNEGIEPVGFRYNQNN